MNLLRLLVLLPFAVLAQDDVWDDEEWDDEVTAISWRGFGEAGLGRRFNAGPLLRDRGTLEELRLRLESDLQAGKFSFDLKGDLAYDSNDSEWDANFRELTGAFTLGSSTDFKIGQQVLTWGTGDLVFLNDLFPKDFVSFFAGRDDEYLKAPGNAVRITRFSETVNVDFVWTPVFEPDVYLTGQRFSFFSPFAGMSVAPDPPLHALDPSDSLSNGEFALRIFKNVDGREYAIYAYHGFFKQPVALTTSLEATFAPLTSIGASLRQPVGPGLINAETSFYMSRDDRGGNNPLLPNDQLRLLIGYEWEARSNFNVGFQYYLEWTQDSDALRSTSFAPQFEPDEYRHLLTNRMTYRSGRDKHIWSLFTFFSPSDSDLYLRPVYTYRHDDNWSVTTGANLFAGDEDHTFFGQLQDASNAYLRIRYNY